MKVQNILETIGNTPHVKLNNLFYNKAEVWIKLEKSNPGGSIKDRIALAMVEDAESKGILKKESVIIEPTSGNTGIGLAMVAAVKKYKLILVMPESMSVERRKLMSVYGAEFVLTPREQGMKGAIEKAKELLKEHKNSWMPQQFENEVNIEIHKKTTALEIINDFPQGIDYLITGVGTGGHISGVAEILKNRFPNLKVFAVEPALSPVISGGSPGPHPIQGIGAGFIPKNLKTNLLDGVIQINKEEAFEFTIRAAKEEGIFCGISTGASLAAVNKKLTEIPAGSVVLTFNYDTGERYLSVDGLF
jgi:cysteine synthase A